MDWTFEYIEDWDECLEGEIARWWDSLPKDHIFNDRGLITTWCNSFRKVNDIRSVWVIGYRNGARCSLWPLVIWHRNWKNAFMQVLMPAGGGDFDYHSPMFNSPVDLDSYYASLIPALIKHGGCDEICLHGIPDCLKPASDQGWVRGEICPMLELQTMDSASDLMKFFKTSLRGDLRRQWRRLSELGDVKVVEFKSWKDAEPEYRPFVDAHAHRWPNAYKIPGFHKALLSDELLSGPVSFSALKVGDKTAAWHLGFKDADKFYYYMPAANPEFLKFSPVKVHLWQLVNMAIADNKKIYDHLRGDELYKDGWSNAAQYVNSLHKQMPGVRSALKHLAYKLRNKIR